MAFLRSGKFFRFLSVGKNLVNFREYEATHQFPIAPCVFSAKNFSSISASIANQSLENSLKRLDQDVRRSGRISRRDLEEILEEIRSSKSATSSQSLLVIRCCGNLVAEEMPEVRTKMVQEIWKTLSKLNVPMDISHYNALLRVYLENEYSFSPTDFLANLQSKGVEPNRVTYQRLISRYCQQGDIDGATRILEYMREKQLPVNENVFNALIMGHSQADDIESAVGILSVMAQAGLEPSADTYTTLLCGFARTGDIESIIEYIAQCGEKEVFLLDKDFLEVIYALAVNGHGDKIDAVFDYLKKAFGYNQDAVNVILRLINRGHEVEAMKILGTMTRNTRMTGELIDTGNFLIRQLIKANRPVEQILSICKELEESKMNTKPIMVAVEAALTSGNTTIAPKLLKEMHAKGIEIRYHYFWPLFASMHTEKEIVELIKMMEVDFGMVPSNQTIRDYIIPKLLVDDDYDKVIRTLQSNGITTATSASTAAYAALSKNNIKKAAEIMSRYDAYYSPGLFRRHLLHALAHSMDYDSYVQIVRQIHDNVERGRNMNHKQAAEEEEEEHEEAAASESAPVTTTKTVKQLQADIVGDLVDEANYHFKTNRLEVIQNILQRLVDQGLSISSYMADKIQNRIGESMTPEISTMLGKLTSGELEPIPIEKEKIARTGHSTMDVVGYERLIARLEEKGENAKGLKRALLVAAIRARDIEKTEEVIERLKAEGFTLTSGVYAQLVELYSSCDKLEEALNAYKQIRDADAEFILDETKTIKFVQAFVNADRLDEGIKFLENNKPKEMPDEKMFNFQTTCWRLLNVLAEKGDAVGLNKLFNAMVANNYIVPNNVLLGPLIKVHLVRNELKQAVDTFEEISQKYRATPWKNDIACRLIQAEDAANLQRITDLSTEIHGEVNSLYDLVFSFIECGRVRQARKILETPGLRSRAGRINYACERYLNENMPTALEGLVEATKDLSHIDRSEIYYSLLQTYIRDVAPEKALGLWTSMQEEDITPSDAFLRKLSDFLNSQGLEVPFHAPEEVPIMKSEATKKSATTTAAPTSKRETRATQKSEAEVSATHASLKSALKTGDPDQILKAKQNLDPTDKVSLTERSQVIEAFVQHNRLKEASDLVFELLDEKVYPVPRIFRFYLNRIAASGDSATLDKIGKRVPSEMKKVLSFDNRVCHSFISSGNIDSYLDKLENAIDSAKTEVEIAKVADEFPRGGAIGIIERNPQYIDRFHQIALKYAEKKILGPINVLWMQHFVKNDPKADDIFKQYLADAPRLMFQHVIQVGREKQDVDTVKRLIGLLQSTKVSEGAIGNAYSCLLDINHAKNDPAACLDTVNACLKDVSFENINRTALLRAKECVEKAGKKFPHTIPEKKSSNQQDSSSSSSSSSSDDEVTRKEKS